MFVVLHKSRAGPGIDYIIERLLDIAMYSLEHIFDKTHALNNHVSFNIWVCLYFTISALMLFVLFCLSEFRLISILATECI